MDKSLFEAVQQKLSAHQSHKTLTRQKSDHLLRDLLFDDAGHRMIATHATKAGVRYRYYVSQPSVHGEARTARLGSVSRVPASEIEQAVVAAIKEQLRHQKSPTDSPQPIKFDRKVLGSLVSRIEVQKNRLVVSLKPTDHSAEPELISVPWQKPPSRRSREILLPHGTLRENIRPERAERRARLVTAIARGRRWLDQLSSGAPTRNNWPNASDARCAKSI